MRKIRSILIITNKEKTLARKILNQMQGYFHEKNICTHVIAYQGGVRRLVNEDIDLAISLGGDGTLLYCARLVCEYQIPIMGINLGDFGFLTEIRCDEWKSAFEAYVEGVLTLSRRSMLQVQVHRGETLFPVLIGLNDAVVCSNGISKIIKLSLNLSSSNVGRYRADGVIVSTATGSTAYSMAAGGPILHPEMEAMILNPICPFTLSNRPLVVPMNETIGIEIEKEQRTEIILTVDGYDIFPLAPLDKIIIKRSEHTGLIVNSHKRNFYEVLRSKLNWSGEPNA